MAHSRAHRHTTTHPHAHSGVWADLSHRRRPRAAQEEGPHFPRMSRSVLNPLPLSRAPPPLLPFPSYKRTLPNLMDLPDLRECSPHHTHPPTQPSFYTINKHLHARTRTHTPHHFSVSADTHTPISFLSHTVQGGLQAAQPHGPPRPARVLPFHRRHTHSPARPFIHTPPPSHAHPATHTHTHAHPHSHTHTLKHTQYKEDSKLPNLMDLPDLRECSPYTADILTILEVRCGAKVRARGSKAAYARKHTRTR